MEITKSSFFEKLPEIQQVINDATFISIDCELTGLNAASNNINAFDTPKQYYEKVYNNAKDFLVIQFGLCAFRYDPIDMVFKQKAYNFYIFPRPINRMAPDHRFLCQASSIDFLITQGFDFTKLFNEGITYLNTQDESKYREKLQETRSVRARFNNATPQKSNVSISADDAPFIDKVFDEIESFIQSDEKERILPNCNAFLRRLIYQSAKNRIGDRASLETREINKKERVLVVVRPKSIDTRNDEEDDKIKEEDNILRNAIGFTTLMRFISESRKLIIGHNMLLDTFHTVDKFLNKLDNDYYSFKECINCIFPNIVDTKFMSSCEPFKDLIPSTVLATLLNSVTNEPFNLPQIVPEDDGPSYSIDSAKEHEAGYDAYITGLCFISMWKYLGDQKKIGDSMYDNFNLLKPFMNRLFLMRLQDAPFLQLDGADQITKDLIGRSEESLNDPAIIIIKIVANPSRDHVFHLSFPKEWKQNDVVQLFSPFGNVFVAWLDEKSAYVALHRRDKNQATVALNTLSQSDTYSIMTFAQRQLMLANPRKLSDSMTPIIKKRRTISGEGSVFNIRKFYDDIQVEPKVDNQEDSPVPILIKPRKRTISKTFTEDNSWE